MKVFSIDFKALSLLADLHVFGSLLQNKIHNNLNNNKCPCSFEILLLQKKPAKIKFLQVFTDTLPSETNDLII